MSKVKSLADLRKMREELQTKVSLREKSDNPEKMVQVKVSMATCGIASGAKEVMNHMIEEMDRQAIDAIVTQTGCMGYCHAEPTIEVTLPGNDPVVFGHVDNKKADEIIEKYVIRGELVDGIIPVNYETVKENKNE
ncbi:(2Fe-2S) ferredoxin domain-containing protein [Carboxylicivirga marina]|uniref:(2Fe-2S) ferredoxin domain-containing protein n=1 Tax=Carboxylicivirga marina TaxID=2800988 RepID=A0ABS1HGM4_9BACT|nr:(2Fe-2S) ferredoxin domain-containing protein [Carboxylicivirga marina]MBK3516776.1 (2Fe-2S) ferredoxin domain-containing protein [Carboxylicivirga marina]